MVEGPGVHRVAIAHRKLLLRQRFTASSPNGKFKDGAAAINGLVLALIEAHGKNIFYFFTRCKSSKQAALENLPEDAIVVHIHFGMSGSFQTFPIPSPEPRPATRLRLIAETVGVVAHLSASICNYGSLELYRTKVESLGPDPLWKDDNKEFFWANMQKSRKKIGALLMDQSAIAGIGNIYRTELLFVIGVHPDQPASSLTRSTFEQIWSEAQRLLQVGVETGSIITVSQDEAGKPFSKLRKGEKRYVYNHKHCQRCDGVVQSWKLAQRTVYACEICQPLMLSSGTPNPSENQNPGDKNFQEQVVEGEHDKNSEEHVIVEEHLHNLKAPPDDEMASTVVSQDKMKCRVGQRRRTVEHQAFKDITTGGLLGLGSHDDDDVLVKSLAPTTPQKSLLSEDTRKSHKRKHKILFTHAHS
eukprot:c13806_g1_i1 orf=169-1413(-)